MRKNKWAKYLAIGGACVLGLGLVLTLWLNSGLARWTLTVATGPTLDGGLAYFAAVNQVFSEERPHVRLQRIQNDTLQASAKMLESGKADLAIARSDIAMPNNGQSIAIFRRDCLVLIVPAHSPVESLQGLAGKKVGLLRGGSEEQDAQLERLLNTILGFYNISTHRVDRVFLSAEEIGPAVAKKQVAGVLALAPEGPGPIPKAIAAIAHATRAQPDLIGDDQAEALAKRIPGTESTEIPVGAFGGIAPKPEEALTTLAVTYRLVARYSLSDFVAGEVARLVFLAKTRLIASSPLAMQIEAPDTEASSLPVHPGAAAFFNGEQASLVDSATNILYLASIILGVFGSGFAWLIDSWRNPKSNDGRTAIERLISIMREAREADLAKLDQLEDEIDEIVERSLGADAAQNLDADQLNVLAIVIRQARQALEKHKKRHLGPAGGP
jgi:TRAP-type uncharacterized transport system substrate-binding protein